jgi:hypothetical protein
MKGEALGQNFGYFYPTHFILNQVDVDQHFIKVCDYSGMTRLGNFCQLGNFWPIGLFLANWANFGGSLLFLERMK